MELNRMMVSNRSRLLGILYLLVVLSERVARVAAVDQYGARHRISPSMPPKQTVLSPQQDATDHQHAAADPLESNANPDRNHDNGPVKLSLIADGNQKNRDRHGDRNMHHLNQEVAMLDNELGEMQVGCGHGLVQIVPAPKVTKTLKKATMEGSRFRRKRSAEKMKDRKRRNYHGSFTVWQPSVYQLTRPYVIPIWGAQGQQPIYFPPQQLYPDEFVDPRKSYLPPNGYLPPTRTTTIGYDDDDYGNAAGAQGNEGDVNLDNRNNFDDAPIWDMEPIQPSRGSPQTRPPPIRTTPAPSFTPSRRTRRPGFKSTTLPSLVHRSENNTNTNVGAQRPNSLRPIQDRPNVVESPNFRPTQSGSSFGGFTQPTTRPRPVQLTSTTQRPSAQPSRAQPSRCVWAIISCCQGNNENFSYGCFEQLGCSGPFWDKSPCDSDFAKAAINLAMQYYNQK